MKKKKVLATVFLIILNISNGFAQFDPLDGPEEPPQEYPIDDNILILLFAAIILSALVFYKAKKQESIHSK